MDPHADITLQINVEDDFLSLMDDSGETREDVKLPDGDVGDRITKMQNEGKDVSKYYAYASDTVSVLTIRRRHCPQGYG